MNNCTVSLSKSYIYSFFVQILFKLINLSSHNYKPFINVTFNKLMIKVMEINSFSVSLTLTMFVVMSQSEI